MRFARVLLFPQTQNFNSALLLGRFVPYFGAPDPPPAYQEKAITRLLDGARVPYPIKSWFEHSTRNRFDPKVYAIDTHLPKTKNRNGWRADGGPSRRSSRLTSIELEPRMNLPSSGCTCSALIW